MYNIDSTITLISRGLFPEEHKGYHKGMKGTVELLYIDRQILKENKTRLENFAMLSIDIKK